MAKIIGNKWRSLDKSARFHYDELAAKERRKYDKAMKYYKMELAMLEQGGAAAQSLATSTEYGIAANARAWSIAQLAKKLGKDGVHMTIKTFA